MSTKQWTLMFYFASDNPLASTIVSQLKALKDAGYHPDTNVIAQFDPHAVKTPVHIFDVNSANKFWNPGKPAVGLDDTDAFVRDLVLDRLWGEKDEEIRKKVQNEVKRHRPANEVFDPPKPTARMSGEQDPEDSLTNFLKFCREAYPARHYVLFILGHGQVVGHDTLLYDAHADQHSITLSKLGQVLRCFNTDVKTAKDPGEVEMVVFHSCSMSALEVAYEIKGAANYMLASQGPMYVGNLPYKRILMRLFARLGLPATNGAQPDAKAKVTGKPKAELMAAGHGRVPGSMSSAKFVADAAGDMNSLIDEHEENVESKTFRTNGSSSNGRPEDVQALSSPVDIKNMFIDMFYDCLYNSYDFQLAGYPFDLCLTNLAKTPHTQPAIDRLADSLKEGLEDPELRQLILLAHWDAQSFYSEDYVDLYDFCFCFRNRCKERHADVETPGPLATTFQACDEMMKELKQGDDNFITRASFAGPAFQYSHGHSVYFPWTKPVDAKVWDLLYPEYRFGSETKWRQFVDEYFKKTQRKTRIEEIEAVKREDPNFVEKPLSELTEEETFRNELLGLIGRIGTQALAAEDRLQKVGPDHPMGKYGPDDPHGAPCECPSIKNYPPFTGEIPTLDGPVRIHTDVDFVRGVPLPKDIIGK